MKIKVLLPALVTNERQKIMTDECRESLVSKYDFELYEDNDKNPKAVAGAWNKLLDPWRGTDYDYLIIVASDTIATPHGLDCMIQCAIDNPNAGMVTGKVTRDLEEFHKEKGNWKYTSKLTEGLLDPACFVLPKGVIEKVGRIDEYFPMEFVERDYIWRCKLAGYDVIQPDVVTWYHPPYAGTIGNDQVRLQKALRKYIQKWGGDANDERFDNPFNDLSLDYTHCHE